MVRILVAFLCVLAAPVVAQPSGRVSGNELMDFCAPNDDLPPFMCLGYILGAADFIGAQIEAGGTQRTVGLCLPSSVTRRQKFEVVMKYLQEHPEQRHYDAAGLILSALVQAFPCP